MSNSGPSGPGTSSHVPASSIRSSFTRTVSVVGIAIYYLPMMLKSLIYLSTSDTSDPSFPTNRNWETGHCFLSIPPGVRVTPGKLVIPLKGCLYRKLRSCPSGGHRP